MVRELVSHNEVNFHLSSKGACFHYKFNRK